VLDLVGQDLALLDRSPTGQIDVDELTRMRASFDVEAGEVAAERATPPRARRGNGNGHYQPPPVRDLDNF
jgi:hypothetical protein